MGDLDQQGRSGLYESLAKIIEGDDSALFVAQAFNALVGLAEVYLRQDNGTNALVVPHRYGYLQSLVVLEGFRQHGLGKRLVEAAQGWAREKGATEMQLSV